MQAVKHLTCTHSTIKANMSTAIFNTKQHFIITYACYASILQKKKWNSVSSPVAISSSGSVAHQITVNGITCSLASGTMAGRLSIWPRRTSIGGMVRGVAAAADSDVAVRTVACRPWWCPDGGQPFDRRCLTR